MEEKNELMTIAEAAEFLRISENAVRLRLHYHKLPCTRISARGVRIQRSVLDKIIKENFVGAADGK